MTDRLKGCTVVFDRDIRDDDAKPILDAIAQIRGVSAVFGEITSSADFMARVKVDMEWRERLIAFITPKKQAE